MYPDKISHVVWSMFDVYDSNIITINSLLIKPTDGVTLLSNQQPVDTTATRTCHIPH